MAFSRDNESVFISDRDGNIKIINWKRGTNFGNDFDFTQNSKKIGKCGTDSICLTKDEKYLLIGSEELLIVFETSTKKVIKEFKLTN